MIKQKIYMYVIDAPLSFLMDSILSLKVKTMKGKRIGACSLAHSTSRVAGRDKAPGWD
jgi:hypothetical protein